MPKKISEIAGEIVDLLTPITSEERQRAVQAALTILGENQLPAAKNASGGADPGDEGETAVVSLPAKAKTWVKQNKLTSMDLAQVFQIDGNSVEVIAASIPGKSRREKTLNAYVLQGIQALLSSGEPSFNDKAARALCKSHGCYDEANHSVYMGDKGNRLTGSKEKDWKLTAPGMADGAALIRTIVTKPE